MQMGRKSHVIVIAVFDNVLILDVAGPVESFTTVNVLAAPKEEAGYRCIIASPSGGMVRTSSGLILQSEPMAAINASCTDTLLIPGRADIDVVSPDRELLVWIDEQARNARRVRMDGMRAPISAADARPSAAACGSRRAPPSSRRRPGVRAA